MSDWAKPDANSWLAIISLSALWLVCMGLAVALP